MQPAYDPGTMSIQYWYMYILAIFPNSDTQARFGKILLMIKKYLSGTKIVLWMFERKVISIWKVILKVLYILTHAEYEANIYH